MLPSKGWGTYEQTIRAIGENRTSHDAKDVKFLTELGMVSSRNGDPELTEDGSTYFLDRFVRQDDPHSRETLRRCVRKYSPAAAIAQMLDGVPQATRAAAETVLRSQGFSDGLTDRSLGSLLALMDRADVISYIRGRGELVVLDRPSHADKPPSSIFISPETPFGNRVWLRRVLEQCDDHIYWLDKHFITPGLEVLWEAVDGNRIGSVRVLSLYLPDYHSGRRVKRQYKDLVKELGHRHVAFEWRGIDSHNIRDTHDRWLIGASTAWNVPNVNAIASGQHSELNESGQAADLASLFTDYWDNAQPIEDIWKG